MFNPQRDFRGHFPGGCIGSEEVKSKIKGVRIVWNKYFTRLRPRLNLRFTIISIVVLSVTALCTVDTFLEYYFTKRLLVRELIDQQIVETRELNQAFVSLSYTMASSIGSGIALTSFIDNLAQTLVSSHHLLSIVVYPDRNGQVESAILLGGKNTYFVPFKDNEMVHEALSLERPVFYMKQSGPSVLFKTFVPVHSKPGLQFVNEFITDYGETISPELEKQIQTSILVSVFAIAFSLIMSYVLGWWITNPLLRLKKFVGDLPELTPFHTTKLRKTSNLVVVDNVNEMSKQLIDGVRSIISDERSSSMKYMGMASRAIIHELRSPATAMRDLLKLLSEVEPVHPHTKDILNHIVTSADHINSVLDDFSRIVHEGKINTIKAHDITSIVLQAISICAPLGQKYGISMSIIQRPGEYVARVDEVRLRMVLINLLKNAIDSMKDTGHGEIQVNLSMDVHHLTVDVIDQGCGIPTERWTDIFTPFTSTKDNGFGLGLPLSAVLIIGMGGNIFVRESSSFGTTMRIVLPAGGFS